MSAQVSYFRLGLFVLIGLALLIGTVVVLGAGALFKPTIPAETYFSGSVEGLAVGAPVKYLGITIGKVSAIRFVAEKYKPADLRQELQFSKIVLVEMALDPQKLPQAEYGAHGELLRERVKAGLRVRLDSGLTTPTFVAADYLDPKNFPPMEIYWEPAVMYIPSAVSTRTQVVNAAERLAEEMQKANIAGLIGNLNSLTVDLDKAVKAIQFEDISKQGVGLLTELRDTNKRLDTVLSNPGISQGIADLAATAASIRGTVVSNEANVQTFLTNLPAISERLKTSSDRINAILLSREFAQTLTGLNQMSLRADNATAEFGKLTTRLNNLVASQQRDVELLLLNLRKVAENMASVTEDAKSNPSRVLFGEPPPHRNPGGSK